MKHTETEENIWEWGLELVHQVLSASLTGTMFDRDVCERLVPLRAVSVHTAPGSSYSSAISVERGGGLIPICCLSAVGFACL